MSWVTSYIAPNIVRYGTKPTQLDQTATSDDIVRYTSFGVTSDYIHHVPLTGLKPATTYYYMIGDPVTPDGNAGLRYFTTLPKVGQRVKDFRLAVAADIGQTNDSLVTINHLIADQVGEGKWAGRGPNTKVIYAHRHRPLSSVVPSRQRSPLHTTPPPTGVAAAPTGR